MTSVIGIFFLNQFKKYSNNGVITLQLEYFKLAFQSLIDVVVQIFILAVGMGDEAILCEI